MRLDVLYVEGPGDIVASYESWRSGREHASETSVTFSSQVFAHCKDRGLSLDAVSYCAHARRLVDGSWTIENLPRAMLRLPKVGYHVSLFWYWLRLGSRALRRRPRVVLIASGVVSWTMAWALRRTGAVVVPVLHNALWPEGFRPRRLPRDLAPWRSADPPPTLVVSPAIRRQLATLGARAGERAIEFRPAFVAGEFVLPPAADARARPFVVLFAGRIEADKGVFDLLDVAARLDAAEPGAYRVEVCGSGSQEAAFARAVEARDLARIVVVRGRLPREQLVARYRAAHVCIVPTRSSFAEGFAQVVAESILLLRPVVTSPVVPAGEPYAAAVELARTDDAASYSDAIARLANDAARYDRLVDACRALRPQILDRSTSFQSALAALDDRLAAVAPVR